MSRDVTRGREGSLLPHLMIKMKKRPNHHHAIVTKSCLKPHSVLKSKPHGEGENEEETSHSSFSHWAADAAGGEHDEQEQEGDDSFGAGSMVMALPDDSADNDDALLIAMAAETSTGSNMVEENKKAVAFSSKASRKSTLALSGYTHEEILNTWYSRHELYDMFDDEAQERGLGRTQQLSGAASSSRSSAPPAAPGRERGADRHTYLTSQAHAERMGLSRTVSTVNSTTRSSSTTRNIHKGDEKRANEKMKGDSKNVKTKNKNKKNNATATNSTNDGAGSVDEHHEEGNNKNDPSASPPEYSSYTVPAAKNSSSPQQQGRQCKLPFVFGRWMKRKPQQEHRPSSR